MVKHNDLNNLSFLELEKEVEKLKKHKEEVTTKKVGFWELCKNYLNKKVRVWEIGKNYVIRTVTMIQVGKLIRVNEHELVLSDCAWVADAGRWTTFLSEGTVKEVEPFPDGNVVVGRGSIIDACLWKHELLRHQK